MNKENCAIKINQKVNPNKNVPKILKKMGFGLSICMITLSGYFYNYENTHTKNVDTNLNAAQSINVDDKKENELLNFLATQEDIFNLYDSLATNKSMFLDTQILKQNAIEKVKASIKLGYEKPNVAAKNGISIVNNDENIKALLIENFSNQYQIINNFATSNVDLMNHYLPLWNEGVLNQKNIKSLTPSQNFDPQYPDKKALIDTFGNPYSIDVSPKKISFSFSYFENDVCSTLMRTASYEVLNEKMSPPSKLINWHVDGVKIFTPTQKTTLFTPQMLEDNHLEKTTQQTNAVCNLGKENQYTKVKNFEKPGHIVITIIKDK